MSTTSFATASPSKVSVAGVLTQVRASPGNIDDPSGWTYTGPSYTSGTGAGNVDRKYIAQLTIVAGGNVVLNLSSLTDSFGNAIAFLRVKQLYIELTTATAAASILIGGATNPFGNWITPSTAQKRQRNGTAFFDGACRDATGHVVVPTTGDQLKIANEDGALAAVVNVEIEGCSA
jgi:hypothetical protein